VKRNEFEHVIAAAANVMSEDEFVVIGSQAVLGSTSAIPDSMLVSMEADIYPAREPARAIDYAHQARAHGLLDLDTMRDRVSELPVEAEQRNRVAALVEGLVGVPVQD
jgi:hypothetical protein